MGIQAQIQKQQLFRMEIRNSEMPTGPQTTGIPCVTYTLDPDSNIFTKHACYHGGAVHTAAATVEHKPEPVRKSAKRIKRMAVSVVNVPRHICNFFIRTS